MSRFLYFRKNKAFTLMEVLIALSVTAISIVPLLHLLVISISLMDSTGCLARASLIGNAKLAEMIGSGYPEIGTDSGIIKDEGSETVFEWRVSVDEAADKELVDLKLRDLRKVIISVIWNEGQRQKQVSLSTYVTINQMAAGAIMQPNESSQ